MTRNKGYNHTIYASFIGYIVQAVVNNFVPLLFLTFQSSYGISLDKITLLVTFNFGIQLLVDMLSVKFVDRIGYRTAIVAAHIFTAAGLGGLTILPELLPSPFAGLLLSVAVYATGGGLLEVLVSPIVEACPTDRKDAAMSLLHSFYCWGHVGVVLLSTVYFGIFGIENWRVLACLWALIPVANAFYYARVPIASLTEEGETGLSLSGLFRNRLFLLMLLLMLCAGASEQGVSQWASAFAEQGLGVSKTVGDLAGPLLFALLMGSARAFYGKYSEKLRLERFMAVSGVLCVCSYLLISLSPWPVWSFAGCALCGLSVGILWPGTFSISTGRIRGGGTAMFALLALAGDLGCAGGPTLVGMVSGALGDDLKKGILAGTLFPVLLLLGLALVVRGKKNTWKIHHVAIIVSDYGVSKDFYVNKLGFEILRENFRPDRGDYKLDLKLGDCELELFSGKDNPARPSYPEACGLRHLAFRAEKLDEMIRELKEKGIETEPVRVDEITNKRMTFFHDPDGLPLELHE